MTLEEEKIAQAAVTAMREAYRAIAQFVPDGAMGIHDEPGERRPVDHRDLVLRDLQRDADKLQTAITFSRSIR